VQVCAVAQLGTPSRKGESLAVGRSIKVWVVAGVVTALSSCTEQRPTPTFCDFSSPLGPSCEASNWTMVGLGVSSSCANCLLTEIPDFTDYSSDWSYCCGFWSCFCRCPYLLDEGCYQGCESNIDADCAMTWAQIWYEARHECPVGSGRVELGCEAECAGQQLAVSLSDLAQVEARLGGAADMFTPFPCESGDGSISLVLDSGHDSSSRDSRADTSEHDSSSADSRADSAGKDALAESTSTEAGDSAPTDANRDATLVDAAGDSD